MVVKDLIEALQSMPQGMLVGVCDTSEYVNEIEGLTIQTPTHTSVYEGMRYNWVGNKDSIVIVQVSPTSKFKW